MGITDYYSIVQQYFHKTQLPGMSYRPHEQGSAPPQIFASAAPGLRPVKMFFDLEMTGYKMVNSAQVFHS